MTSVVRRVIHGVQTFVPRSSGGAVVLAYHLVGAGTGSPVDLPEPVFRRQMDEIAGDARAVGLPEAVRPERSDENGPPAVVVTFDDAYRNFFEVAWPIMCELGVPATLYVPVGFVQQEAPGPLTGAGQLPPATWDQFRDAVGTGLLTVGSHSWTHADARGLGTAEADHELGDSRRVLEDRLGVPVTSFCYPRGLWNDRAVDLVRSHYETAVVGGGCRYRPGSTDPHTIPRVPIRRDGPASIESIVRSGVWLEEWFADKVRRLVR